MREDIEIEKRYLLKKCPPDLKKYPSVEIEDVKILTGERHPHLRLRRYGDKYKLTKKYPIEVSDSLMMREETINLNETEFYTFKKLPNTSQKKIRYFYPYKGLMGEVDIWQEKLEGLAIVEFEFNDEDEADSFDDPDFALLDVTQAEWISTGFLSGKTYEEVKDRLKRLGYKKLVFKP
jgi:adenylate cyclase